MTCNKNPQRVREIFEEISPYYDFMNNVISLGTHLLIKFLTIKELNPQQDTMLLDLCCGTGDYTKIISKFYPKVKIIGLDFSSKMLKIAKLKNPKGTFMQGDCTNLPFRNNEFNYVTMSFGLRNIQDRQAVLKEIYRVLDVGGLFLHLDFGKHNNFSKVFNILVPLFVKLFGKNSNHYRYLLDSKEEFPEPAGLIREFKAEGFRYKKRRDYLFGVISLQIMEKAN